MRAIAVSEFGAAPELLDVPTPAPGPGEVLVRLHAAGFNPYDLKVADGALKDVVPHRFPLVLGVDGAGEVAELGPGVSGLRQGERVYGTFFHPAKGLGSYAEYGLARVDTDIARMPGALAFTQAAAVPTASMTAYNLVRTARVGTGQRVLVVGASGGVGQSAVQLAAGQGGEVIATGDAASTEFLRGQGASEVVDYTAGSVRDQVLRAHPDGVDVVIDTVSDPSVFAGLADLVRAGGIMLSTIGSVDADALTAREIRAVNLVNAGGPELLATLADLIDASRLKVRVESEVPLAEAPRALAALRKGSSRGKTVFEI